MLPRLGEWQIILWLALFSFIWIFFVIPFLTTNDVYLTQNPIVQYFLYNLGFISLTTATFGLVLTLWEENRINLTKLIKNGIASWLGVSFIFDLWQPPFYIDLLGNPVHSTEASSLANTTIDGALVFFYNSLFPTAKDVILFNISLLYVLVYIFTPILALILMALLLSTSKFKKVVLNG